MARRIIPLLLAMTGLAMGNAGAQLHAVPIAAPGTLYEMERYSVRAPQGKDWFELKRDKRYVYFGKKIASRTHAFIATAIAASLTEKFANPQEFRDHVSRALPLRGDERHSVLQNLVEIDDTLGRFCVRYYTKSEDRQAPYAGGKTLLEETYGVSCLHPDYPGLSVDVSYTERANPGEASASLRAEGEGFVRSLRFTTP